MSDQEEHRSPLFLRIRPSPCGVPKLPKYLPHVTGIYVLLDLNHQGDRLPAHPEVNLGVMSSIRPARLFDPTDRRLRIGELPQGFQKPIKQLPLHFVRAKHHCSRFVCCAANMDSLAHIRDLFNIHCAANITDEHTKTSWLARGHTPRETT